ncbi:MAG: ABC transporter permease [Paracoccaceae bacterium]|nr:ABC transporter permease [Paracoccaceae bacterium]|tara:strand:- start:2051 stop:3202 length:1152 start_codon:yes stop_codon:yes gene_type:complete
METISNIEIWQIFFMRLWPAWVALAITFSVAYRFKKNLGAIGHLFDNPVGLIGLFIVLFWIYAAIFADLIALFDPLEQSGLYRRKPPGTVNASLGIPYIFGTDTLGRDLFSRMIHGSQIVLLIAPAASLVAYVVGITLGLPAGYIGGKFDTVLSFLANLVLAFPVILLFYLLVAPGIRETILPNIMAGVFFLFPIAFAVLIVYSRFSDRPNVLYPSLTVIFIIGAWLYLGLAFNSDPLGLVSIDPNELNIFAAVVFATSPGVFRLVRGLTMDIKTRDYVSAAMTRGEGRLFIMIWEILPNARGPLIVDSCLRIGYVTILLGTLGFFGLGMEPESPDWGSMINQTRSYIRLVPTIVLPPTLALASFVLGLNLLADGLREESVKD